MGGDPFEDRFWVEIAHFLEDEGDKEGVFVDDHGAAAAESLDEGDVIFGC